VTSRQLGVYQLQTLLGAGGMGEVYRARDTKLGRDVAVKILPPGVAGDPDRLLRFEREARALAALNHPHIGAIYGVEDSGGVHALVLELVEGPTLADRIARGPIPPVEAIAIARQIAEALDAAHERGIVHRDLKPSNIKITPGGAVKVLDFGLAKAADPDGSPDLSHSPTVTVHGTRDGVILGTAAYMSPEQARGQAVDKRADIWAFGCVLYEMLTATRAFGGDNVSDTLASVLRSEPDLNALPPAAAPFAALLKRSLEKDPARRMRDIADATLWLDDASGDASSRQIRVAPVRRSWWVAVAAAVLGLIVGATLVGLRPRTGSVPSAVTRFELVVPPTDPFDLNSFSWNVAISPDGTRVVYTATRGGVNELVMRRLDQLTSSPIPGTEGAFGPFFSADGLHIGFSTTGELKRIPVDGGPVTVICKISPVFLGATWGADNTIVFSDGGRLYRVPASGGDREDVASPDAGKEEADYTYPTVLAGRVLLYSVRLRNRQSYVVARRDMGRGAPTTIVDGFAPRYLPSGHLFYAQEGRLLAVRFDPAALAAVGSPVTVLEGVATKFSDGVANAAIASNGTAVYVSGPSGVSPGRLAWIDRHGKRITYISEQPLAYPRNVRLSPDGRRLAVALGPPGIGDVWIYDLSGAAQPLKLTFRDHNSFPVWSPDGERIAFVTMTTTAIGRLFSLPADGSSVQPERLSTADVDAELPTSWSPDGSAILFYRSGLWTLRLTDGVVAPFLQTPFAQFGGQLSPNGRWVAYASAQTGTLEIWVRPFPGPGAPTRVSSDGGHDPVWSRDGTELFYGSGPKLKSARVVTDAPAFHAETPQTLFEGGFAYNDSDPTIRMFDVAADGRFLVIERVEQHTSLVVAQHWDEELKRLLNR